MFPETPVYDRLVAERGNIPALVRGEADRLHRQLAQVLPPAADGRPGPVPTDAHH